MYLKKSGTYYILREFHKQVDENDDVLELPLENLIQMLIGDEPEIGDGNLKNIEIPEDIQKKFDEIDIDNNKWKENFFIFHQNSFFFCFIRDVWDSYKTFLKWKNAFLKFAMKTLKLHTKLTLTCSKSTVETLEKGEKYVQS